jgi:hypothetical protein
MHYSEHGGVHTDPKRQRQNRCCREGGGAPQQPERMTDVLQGCFQLHPQIDISGAIPEHCRIAQQAQGLALRLSAWHSSSLQVGGTHGHVELELLVDRRVQAFAPKHV